MRGSAFHGGRGAACDEVRTVDKSGRVLEMKILSALLVALGAVVLVAVSSASDTEATYIEGRVVSGDETPEAGVWVIAERDLYRDSRSLFPQLNTYTRGLDGRIDDPHAGWKGRGLWFNNGLDPLLHSEVPQSYVGWIQLRPNPLAR